MKLTAEKLIEVLQEKVNTGGDFDIQVWDADVDCTYEVSSITFEWDQDNLGTSAWAFLNFNETPTQANQHKPLWAIPPEEPPELEPPEYEPGDLRGQETG